MSTLRVTNLLSPNTTLDLTIATGNAGANAIFYTNNNIKIGSGGTANLVFDANGTATLSYTMVLNSTGYLQLPVGNTGQRPTGANGMIRYNSETDQYESFKTSAATWGSLGGASSGSAGKTFFLVGGV